jgi:hypothetical protein
MKPTPPSPLTRLHRWLAGVGLAAVILAGAIGCIWPATLLPAYRFGLFACLAPAVGSLLFTFIHRCTGGAWGRPLAPFLAATGRLAPWIWLGVTPLLFFTPIVGANAWSYDGRAMLALRAVVYAVVLFGVTHSLARTRAAWVGPAGLIVLVFTFHLLSNDWLVALEPDWNSTAFSLIWLVGQAVTGLGVAVLGALLLGVSPDAPGASLARPLGIDWGNLLLTTALLWCYVMFAEFLIIWSGNLPRETAWFFRRLQGAWVVVPVLLVALNFLAPLVGLLSRGRKRSARNLGLVALLLLAGQFIYLAWVILPAFSAGHTWSGVLAALLLGVGFLALGFRHVLATPPVAQQP